MTTGVLLGGELQCVSGAVSARGAVMIFIRPRVRCRNDRKVAGNLGQRVHRGSSRAGSSTLVIGDVTSAKGAGPFR